MPELLRRITINPKQCGGRPCIRGMRIRVSDVLDLFVAGLSTEEILEEMPDLERDDLKASLAYVSRKLNHPVLVAWPSGLRQIYPQRFYRYFLNRSSTWWDL